MKMKGKLTMMITMSKQQLTTSIFIIHSCLRFRTKMLHITSRIIRSSIDLVPVRIREWQAVQGSNSKWVHIVNIGLPHIWKINRRPNTIQVWDSILKVLRNKRRRSASKSMPNSCKWSKNRTALHSSLKSLQRLSNTENHKLMWRIICSPMGS
jgi:hypothetical protein